MQDGSVGDADAAASAESSSDALLPERIEILYASETGNAQDVAERVGREIRRRGGRCTVQSMEFFDVADLPHIPLLILITSTHGRGEPPPAMLPLWKALLRQGLPDDILEDVSFALYGLGDSSYEKYCYAGKILARRMLSLGANLVGSTHGSEEEARVQQDLQSGYVAGEKGKERELSQACLAWGDERAPDGIEETFIPWLDRTVSAMLPYLPSPPAEFQAYSTTDLPPPLYALSPARTTRNGLDHAKDGDAVVDQVTERANGLHLAANGSVKVSNGTNSDSQGVMEQDTTWTTLSKNERVTPVGWWQDVREIELDLEDTTRRHYAAGSVCSIRPKSSSEDIQRFLQLMQLETQADDPVTIEELCPDQPVPWSLPHAGLVTTLRTLLTNHLDLRASPRKSFFEWMRRFTPDEREQERLDEFIADPDEIHTYATRPSRTIVETLADFRATRIPITHILEVLPPIRRRRFSIASASHAHPGKVQLLIALVDYKTNLAIRRQGLCSSWLKRLQAGERVSIGFDEPTLFLPYDPDTPVILIGPGTGVAPMRAFAEERVLQGAAKATRLYFGCRSREQDLFFADDWATMTEQGAVVRVAASRDQADKIYVQDLIREDAELIFDWVYKRNAHIYISGSSNAMPKAVRAAFAWCLSKESGYGTMNADDAVDYVERLFETGGRGAEETW